MIVREYSELLLTNLDIFGGKIDRSTLYGFRIHAAQTWLTENPNVVLQTAAISRFAAQAMLAAAGVYLARGGVLTNENQRVIGELLIRSDEFLSKKGGEDRANRTIVNIAIVLSVEGLKRKYKIKPTRNAEGGHQSSGCDIIAEAVQRSGLGTPNTYDSVKRIWDKRTNLLGQVPHLHAQSDDLFGAIMHDLRSYIETVAMADISTPASSVRANTPKT